jgi:hypothetical protein
MRTLIRSSLTIYAAAYAIVFASLPQCVETFVSISRWSSALVYGGAMDMLGPKLLMSGVDFKGDFKHITQTGQADADCFLSVGSAMGFDRKLFDSPQMCLDIQVLGIPNQPSPPGLPDAVVVAMAGQQPMLLTMDYTGFSNINLLDPVKLPFEHFPAVMTSDKNLGGIYVALHPTNGLEMKAASDFDPVDELRNTRDYLQQLTHPKGISGTAGTLSPRIFKYNILDQKAEWQTTFNTEEGKSMISGMEVVLARKLLVVGGSSTGYGPAIGAGARSDGDWDGYLTILDMESGAMDTQNTTSEINAPHSVRIFSQRGQDDMVHNLCTADDKVYVVGSTTGKIEGDKLGGGFIMKIDIDTLNVIWKKQFVGLGIEATHCAIRSDVLFVGGIVPPGIQLDNPNGNSNSPATETVDIFTAMFNAVTGDMAFVRQIDSHRDDQLVEMLVNPADLSVILVVNARDFEEGTNDLAVMSVGQQGQHDWQNLSPGIDPFGGQTGPATVEDPPSSIHQEAPPTEAWIIVVAIVVPVALLFCLVVYYFCSRRSSSSVPLVVPLVVPLDHPSEGPSAPEDNFEIAITPSGDERKVV